MEQKLIKLNHLIVGFCWLSFLCSVITTLLSIGNIWTRLGLFLIPPFRYLIFEIYPKAKEETFKVEVDRLMPFSTLSSFISRPANSRQQKFLSYIGGAFWFIALMVFNGYRLLWLDTTRFHEGEKTVSEIKDRYDEIGQHYHLYDFQIEHLRSLGESQSVEEREKFKQQLEELRNQELATQISPLGLSITQKKISRYQRNDGTFERKNY